VTRPGYEYKVREQDRHTQDARHLQEELERLGKEGWLLITEHDEKLIFVRPIVPPPPPPDTGQAVTGTVSIATSTTQGDSTMLTVDAAGVAKFQFDDDKGDIVGPPQGDGSGVVVSFASDNPEVVSGFGATSVGVDDNGNAEYTASPTVVADGTYNLTATVANTSGAPLVDDDGSTAFVQAPSVPVTLAGGQATTGTTSES
jgi:hypothetical protein